MKNGMPQRKQMRLKEYDYSQEGYYFITICTKNREKVLSQIINNEKIIANDVGVGVPDDPKIKLTNIGLIVQKYINKINTTYENVMICEYVIMPNHVHMIININRNIIKINGSSRTPTPTLQNATLPFIISTLKRFINKEIAHSIWQRNYYEHIIRNEKEYYKILEYMKYNPIKRLDSRKTNK